MRLLQVVTLVRRHAPELVWTGNPGALVGESRECHPVDLLESLGETTTGLCDEILDAHTGCWLDWDRF
jgi:hypothetical protein